MNKHINQKAKRIFAAMLALTVTTGTLTYTPLSGVVEDVAVTANALDTVAYIGADGTYQTITDYTLVTSYTGTETQQWSGGNYVVNGDVTIRVEDNDAIFFSGTVNLILLAGSSLTVTSTGSGKSAFTGNKEFNIFSNIKYYDSQGALIAEGDTGIKCKCLNVYGGNVILSRTSNVLFLSDDDDSGTQGFTVNGGRVSIGGSIEGFSTLDLNGGDVEIFGKLIGTMTHDNSIVTLGYTNPTDRYYFSDLKYDGTVKPYTVKVAENKAVSLKAYDNKILTGEISPSDRDLISSFHPYITPVTATVTVADDITGGTVVADKTSEVLAGDTVTLTVTPDENYELNSLTVTSGNTTVETTDNGDGTCSFIMPASDVAVNATFKQRFTVTLPDNMEITNGVTLSGGKVDDGTVIEFAPVENYIVTDAVTANGETLTPDDNGKYTITVNGNVTVSADVRKDISLYGFGFEDDQTTFAYTGEAIEPVVYNYWVTQGTDYTVSYSNNIGSPTEAVTATATITGTGDYAGTKTLEFRITPFSIADCTIEVDDLSLTYEDYSWWNIAYRFSDCPSSIGEKVSYGDKVLTYGTDYKFGSVVYADTTGHNDWDNPGELGDECKVEIIGMGDYAGTTLSNAFKVIPPDANGTFGENDAFEWQFKGGKLTITGTGAMPEINREEYPWYNYASYISSIEIGEGITSVAANAFAGNQNVNTYGRVKTVKLPSTVTTIGANAFAYMTGLKSIDLTKVTAIGTNAFDQCTSLNITVPKTVTNLADVAFSGCRNVSFYITWLNYDGTELATTTEKYSNDDIPSYSGETPIKPADVQYTYTFSGWSPELVPVHTNKTYTAQFSSTVNKYNVTFKKLDGTVFATIPFDYGTKPVYPDRVLEKLNAQYSMVIVNWSDGVNTYDFDNLPTVSGEAEYTATIAQEENSYTVTWKNWDGTVLETDENVLYNTNPVYNGETPNKTITWEGRTDIYNFTFAGWDKTISPVSDDVTYTAQFTCDGLDSYMDGDTLVLKGDLTVVNPSNSYYAIRMPLNAAGTAPVNRNDVKHIRVDDAGATFPANSLNMFLWFDKVTDIDLRGANTSNVTDMNSMFWNCQSLENLDISGFDTSHVTNMREMFVNCEKLTTLDLSGFDTSSVEDMSYMFVNCENLTTIYVSDNWSTGSVTDFDQVFFGCSDLKGGSDTAYDSDHIDKTYARIDKDGQPGYLTGIYSLTLPDNMEIVTDADEEYKVGSRYFEGVVLTFKAKTGYGASNVKANGSELTADENGVYTITMPEGSVTVTAVALDADTCYFDEYTSTLYLRGNVNKDDVQQYKGRALSVVAKAGATLPEDSSFLFNGFNNVKAIDLAGANTSNVTNMSYMFNNCKKLTELDLRGFDTSSVENMSFMFSSCENLTELDLSSFDTKNVTDMRSMFLFCDNLTELDLSRFDTSKVMSMSSMFSSCENLTELDLSSFDTRNVTDMRGMFLFCENLTELDLSSFDTSKVSYMNSMFDHCNLTELDLSRFDTSSVTDMSSMFDHCMNLTELDLSSFDTSKVSYMNSMFSSCENLTTIYVSDKWSNVNVIDSDDVFRGCDILFGGNKTAYSIDHLDAFYARIDKGEQQPGYLTGIYSLTLPENMEIVTDADEEYKVGSRYFEGVVLTFKAKTGYGASNVEANGSELTEENGVYTITMPEGSVTVTADIVKYTPVVINYVDINGITTPTTVYKEIYANAEYTLPGTPYLDGYNFTDWTVNGTQIDNKAGVIAEVRTLVSDSKNVNISVVYTPGTDSHKASVVGGTLRNGINVPYDTDGDFTPSIQLYADANTPEENMKFDHWEVSYDNGTTWTTVGYNATYAFRMPAKDIQLRAIFAADTTVTAKKGIAYIESVTVLTENKLAFVSKVSVPEGARILKAGIVADTAANLGEKELTCDTAKYVSYNDTDCYNYLYYKYTWTKINISESDTWCVRAYLEYRDENNEVKTVYGDLVKANLGGIINEEN